MADIGTLFLDEIGELPLSIKAKLLRAIQEGEIQRVGSEKLITVNVRLLTATNRNLQREVEKGNFRVDLFHRLNVYPPSVSSLRDRNDDIPLLAGFFSERMQRRLGLGPVRISTEAMEALIWTPMLLPIDPVVNEQSGRTVHQIPGLLMRVVVSWNSRPINSFTLNH